LAPSKAALTIATKFAAAPANTSPLGEARHMARMNEHAELIENFCRTLGIAPATALNAMECGHRLVEAAPREAYAEA